MPEKSRTHQIGDYLQAWNDLAHRTCLTLIFLIFSICIANTKHADAAADDSAISQLCDHAARVASESQEVPYDVLMAISRAETGRFGANGLRPWPWTVNMEGTGKWFADEDQARAYVFRHFKIGARSFDIGCFQVNYKWHGSAFRSIDDMFDPILNATYAAKFLRQLYREFGDWSIAAGAYHSRTPTFARAYSARFEKIRGSVSGDHDIARLPIEKSPVRLPTERPDLFGVRNVSPLIGQGTARLGSLVPVKQRIDDARRAFIIVN